VAHRIFTHFIREEDPGMTSGRLDDELSRMSAIADQIEPHSLVLFNESFAGTNESEGSEIGYQVVRALLDAQVRVFYVTHRFEFAERFLRDHPRSALFLRAERGPDGRRTYKLAVKEPLPTSFGEDLYYQLGGWLDEDNERLAQDRADSGGALPPGGAGMSAVRHAQPALGEQPARDHVGRPVHAQVDPAGTDPGASQQSRGPQRAPADTERPDRSAGRENGEGGVLGREAEPFRFDQPYRRGRALPGDQL
jgi:hypothetical protein